MSMVLQAPMLYAVDSEEYSYVIIAQYIYTSRCIFIYLLLNKRKKWIHNNYEM